MQTGETAAVRLYDAITVGRNASNDFVINNPVVSGRHAVIRTDGRDLYIEDCNTLNGTLLNGKKPECAVTACKRKYSDIRKCGISHRILGGIKYEMSGNAARN